MADIVNIPPRSEREATEEDWRQFFKGADFEPPTEGKDPKAADFKRPPDDPQDLVDDLTWARAAFSFLLMPKDELTKVAGEMLADEDFGFEVLVQNIARVHRNYEGLARMTEAAGARLVAAAYCALPEPDPGEVVPGPGA